MLKPGSSKLKESEAELLSEIKDFEEQEDKTLQNMEETMRMMSSTMTSTALESAEELPPSSITLEKRKTTQSSVQGESELSLQSYYTAWCRKNLTLIKWQLV